MLEGGGAVETTPCGVILLTVVAVGLTLGVAFKNPYRLLI